MGEAPQTWHYGLVAQWWAEFGAEGPEIGFYHEMIASYGQPALDLACGTGRLLLPYLRAGLDVDGCDISADMIDRCRQKAELEGLSPRLAVQAMHELDLPRSYKTIFICGSWGISGSRQQDLEALRRIYRHLDAGGVLAFDVYMSYGNANEWQYWASGKRKELPEAWPPPGERDRAADGTEYELRMRIYDVDPLDQVVILQLRVEQFREQRLVAEEERLLRARRYFRNELLAMLQETGFREVDVRSGFSDREAGSEASVLVYIARK